MNNNLFVSVGNRRLPQLLDKCNVEPLWKKYFNIIPIWTIELFESQLGWNVPYWFFTKCVFVFFIDWIS